MTAGWPTGTRRRGEEMEGGFIRRCFYPFLFGREIQRGDECSLGLLALTFIPRFYSRRRPRRGDLYVAAAANREQRARPVVV